MHEAVLGRRPGRAFPKHARLESRNLLKSELQERSQSEQLRSGQHVPRVMMSSHDRLTSASGARHRSSSDRLQTRMGSKDRLAREVRASSRTQRSRGLVRPAQEREDLSVNGS